MADIKARRYPEVDLTVFNVSGKLDIVEAISASDAVRAEHEVQDSVWDLRQMITPDVDMAQMRAAYSGGKQPSLPGEGRRTALVVSDEFNAVLAHMFEFVTETSGSSTEYKTFTKLDEAYAWLDKSEFLELH